MGEGMYEKTTGRVVAGEGASTSLRSITEAVQRAEPAAVHSCTVPHHQEDGGEGCHEETPLHSQVLKLLDQEKSRR